MSYMSSSTSLVLILLFLAVIVSPATATDHIVGANKGWNPGINYTHWANNHTIYVNDFISFRYKKSMHNVFEVNKTGYENCTTEGAVGNWSSGKDFIPLKKPGKYYFICGIGGCADGMKVSIVVHSLPPPPSASISASKHSSSSSESAKSTATKATLEKPLSVPSALLVGLVALGLMGCGSF